MIKLTKRDKKTNLEKEIDDVLSEMELLDKDSKEYRTRVVHLERLYKAKGYDKSRHVSPDTIAIVAGNLLGILIILGYEKANVITSKALGFVIKGRV